MEKIMINKKISNYMKERNIEINDFIFKYIEIDKYIRSNLEESTNKSEMRKMMEELMDRSYNKLEYKLENNNLELKNKFNESTKDMNRMLENTIKSNNMNNYKEITNQIIQEIKIIYNDKFKSEMNDEMSKNKRDIMDKLNDIKLTYNDVTRNNSFTEDKNRREIIDKLEEIKFTYNEIKNNNVNEEINKNKIEIIKKIEDLIKDGTDINEIKKEMVNEYNKREIDMWKKLEEIKITLSYHKEINSDMKNLMNNGIESIKEKININLQIIETVNEIKNIFKSDNKKGRATEQIFYNKLIDIYGNENIEDLSKTPHSCDISIKLEEKSPVLLEIKNYTKNVPSDEVRKFISDCKENDNICGGILVSNDSGIATKSHLSFEFINNKTLVYLHYVNYDIQYIKMALNIIFSINKTLKDVDNSFLKINEKSYKELQFCFNEMLSEINNFIIIQKKQLKSLEKMRNNKLQNFFSKDLSQHLLQNKNVRYKCPYCHKIFNNITNLPKHIKTIHKKLWKDVKDDIIEIIDE